LKHLRGKGIYSRTSNTFQPILTVSGSVYRSKVRTIVPVWTNSLFIFFFMRYISVTSCVLSCSINLSSATSTYRLLLMVPFVKFRLPCSVIATSVPSRPLSSFILLLCSTFLTLISKDPFLISVTLSGAPCSWASSCLLAVMVSILLIRFSPLKSETTKNFLKFCISCWILIGFKKSGARCHARCLLPLPRPRRPLFAGAYGSSVKEVAGLLGACSLF